MLTRMPQVLVPRRELTTSTPWATAAKDIDSDPDLVQSNADVQPRVDLFYSSIEDQVLVFPLGRIP